MRILFLDTETTNDIDCPLMYDIGGGILDTDTNEFTHEFSFVVADIFCNKELMSSAYFIDKVPQYWNEIKNGSRVLASFYNIRNHIYNLMKDTNTTKVIAHNMRFDYISTHTTQRYLTKSKYRWFFPYGTEFLDTLKMSRIAFGNNENYVNYCKENEYLCKNGTPRFTAEILYRFITNDNNFVESHTGLQDVLIEKEIFTECIKLGCDIESGYLW